MSGLVLLRRSSGSRLLGVGKRNANMQSAQCVPTKSVFSSGVQRVRAELYQREVDEKKISGRRADHMPAAEGKDKSAVFVPDKQLYFSSSSHLRCKRSDSLSQTALQVRPCIAATP